MISHSKGFLLDSAAQLQIEEWPTELQTQGHSEFEYIPDLDSIGFRDENLTVLPLPDNHIDTPIYSYLGIPHKRNKFLPHKARALGCQPHKHFKPLINGQSVTLHNGTVVKPNQVSEQASPSNAFMVINIDHEKSIEQLVNENANLLSVVRKEHFKASPAFKINVVYHSVPLSCFKNPLYRQRFMVKWGKQEDEVTHILDTPQANLA